MRLRHGIGLAVFCVLAASRWLVHAEWPEALPPLLGRSLGYAVVGVGALVLAASQTNKARWNWHGILPLTLAGLLLMVVPLLLQQFARAAGDATSTALDAMVPLCVVLGVTIAAGDASRALMMPALLGLAGALLLLPWRLPVGPAETVAFGLLLGAVLLTAAGSVWLHGLLRGEPLMRSVTIVALGNAAVLGFVAFLHGERFLALSGGDLAAISLEGVQVVLLVWLVGEVPPERLSARFFLVPLIAILEGAMVLRASFDARMAIGILLLLFGSGHLLFGRRDGGVPLGLR